MTPIAPLSTHSANGNHNEPTTSQGNQQTQNSQQTDQGRQRARALQLTEEGGSTPLLSALVNPSRYNAIKHEE